MLPRHCSRQVRKIAACKTGESVERDEDLRPDKCWPPNKVCALFLKKHNNKKHTAVTEMVNELLFYGAFQVTKHFTLQSMIHTHKKKKSQLGLPMFASSSTMKDRITDLLTAELGVYHSEAGHC